LSKGWAKTRFLLCGLVVFLGVHGVMGVAQAQESSLPGGSDDFAQLAEGLTQIGMPGYLPGPLRAMLDGPVGIVFGESASYLGTDTDKDYELGKYPPIAMATTFENGRVIAISSESFFIRGNVNSYDNLHFGVNAMEWLTAEGNNRVLYDDRSWPYVGYEGPGVYSGLGEALAGRGYTVDRFPVGRQITTSILRNYAVYMICTSWYDFSQAEIDAIIQFVANGGGFFLTGVGWSWVEYQGSLDKYPMNKIASQFGIWFMDGSVINPVDHIRDTDYSPFHRFYYPPTADFTWELVSGNEIRFDASTSHDPDGHIVSYKWDFDNDGSWDYTGTDPMVVHDFPHRFACRTVLMVVDDKGQTDTIVKTPYLPSISPTASFTWEGLFPEGARLLVKPKAGDRIRFDATASTDADGEIVKYEWDWNSDGTWDTEAKDPVTKHAFMKEGTQQVTLRVIDNDGLTDQTAQIIVIEHRDLIQADFTFHVVDESLHKVQLDASTSIDTMGEIVRYEWDWDSDGIYDTAVEMPEMIHRFPTDGPFQVTLTIVDDQGNRASCMKEVGP